MMFIFLALLPFVAASTSPVDKKDYKDQTCTDPRTMRKHPAYSEWADAYSCTRHRCQPGGRNLAIYTVGCKRVEAPESAIECEEVVEDTNMQFPFCCTRLRCLVVVRGEVWTRVLGQPWEVLPAAPWSHMYKMKKPPPTDSPFLSKVNEPGPVYELTEPEMSENKVLRSGSRKKVEDQISHPNMRSITSPDLVIALTTDDKNSPHKSDPNRLKRGRKSFNSVVEDSKESIKPHQLREPEADIDEGFTTEKIDSEEPVGLKLSTKNPMNNPAWTEIPPNQWHGEGLDQEVKENNYQTHDQSVQEESKDNKQSNFQALVNAIGSRMRDIESVVQKMSEKVQKKAPEFEEERLSEDENINEKPKRPNTDLDNYRRFADSNQMSKYLHVDGTTESPQVLDSTNNYFNDPSNNVLRKANTPKEPPVYMAPVESKRRSSGATDVSEEVEKKKKKHSHKKHRSKSHKNKKHRKDLRKKSYKANSDDIEKNVVASGEDSGTVNT